MTSTRYIKPTESELEILQVLWLKGEASVREVHRITGSHKRCGLYNYPEADADYE
jgi:hypothetical protein